MERQCRRCDKVKSVDEFATSNGKVLSWCKECKREARREWGERNSNHLVEYERRRWQDQRNVSDSLRCANKLCNQEFRPQDARQKYCSDNCRTRANANRYGKRKRARLKKAAPPRACRMCGKLEAKVAFVPRNCLCVDCLPVYRNQQYEKHKKYYQGKRRERKMRRKNAEGSHTEAQWEELKAEYDYMCLSCGKGEPDIELTRDHVVPLVNGGTDDIDNIQPLCHGCNSKKNAATVDYR